MGRKPLPTSTPLPDNTVFITEPDPKGEYVSQAEYIRRRHEADLKKDALADPLFPNTLHRHIKRGHIEVLKQGGNVFIDWNKYHNFVFKRYRQAADTSRKKA